MVKIFLAIFILVFCNQAEAARWVIFDEVTKQVKRTAIGGVKVGCANDGYVIIQSNCIWATTQEFDDAQQPNKKVDKSIIMGSRVIDMTQAEIDAIVQAKADAQAQAELQRLADIDSDFDLIDINDISLPLTDAEIDSLGAPQDVKTFLKKLVRYIVSQQSSN